MSISFSGHVTPDWEGLRDCILRKGAPRRVHFIELFLDPEVQDAVCDCYGIGSDLDAYDTHYAQKRQIALQSFLGYDYVRCGLDAFEMPLERKITADTAGLGRSGGRSFVEQQRGPITTWDEFEAYPWPQLTDASTRSLEWYERHLPDNMCIIGSGGFAHFAEFLTWLMGYETLCMALFEQRDLVAAISRKLFDIYDEVIDRILQFDCVKLVWGSDDMGFRTGTMISPDDLRAFVLPGHKRMAEKSHAAGRPYLLHCCGQIEDIMPDLLDDVRIDARHSFEDNILPVVEAKRRYGDRIAVLGGIDMDFLCRADETSLRKRVRETLDACQPGGGYCLGTGNSVANYVPLGNYLIMLDEGRRYSGA